MELYQLKLFVDLADYGNFTKVASENYVTQAAVTLQIRKLESELGVPLFHRTTRTVTLVEAGHRLLPYARDMLRMADEARVAVRDTKEEVTGLVRVAAVHSIGLYELPPYIKKFLKRFPEVDLRMDYRTSDEIYKALHAGDTDIGLVAYPQDMPRIDCIPFLTDHLVLACQKDHPFAHKKAIALSELEGQDYVHFGEDSPTRRATDATLSEHGISVHMRMECDNIEIIKQMVEMGFGVSLLPRKAMTNADREAGLRVVPLKDITLERPVALLLLKNAPRFKAMRAFVTTLCGSRKGQQNDGQPENSEETSTPSGATS